MKFKDLLFPLIIIPLGIGFVAISFFLWMRGGNDKHLIKAKIRIGAMMLSFSYFVSCGSPQVTCYEMPPPQNSVMMNLGDSIHAGDTIEGNIYDPSFANYSYRIMDSSGTVKLQESLLSQVSGSFAKTQGSFFLVTDSNLRSGQYILKIYSGNFATIAGVKLLDSMSFRINH